MAGETLLICRNTREGGEILLSYQEHKDGRGELTVMPGTQERYGRLGCPTRNTRISRETLLSCQKNQR
jgi:hypothetical protein